MTAIENISDKLKLSVPSIRKKIWIEYLNKNDLVKLTFKEVGLTKDIFKGEKASLRTFDPDIYVRIMRIDYADANSAVIIGLLVNSNYPNKSLVRFGSEYIQDYYGDVDDEHDFTGITPANYFYTEVSSYYKDKAKNNLFEKYGLKDKQELKA